MIRPVALTTLAPSKVIAVHLTYRSRAAERGKNPAFPSYFFKPVSSIAASGDAVQRPQGCELLAFEGEIALVIGRRAHQIEAADGWSYVRWVTAANDFGVYDLRYADNGSNVRSKGIDGFTPTRARIDRRDRDRSIGIATAHLGQRRHRAGCVHG